MTNPARQPQGIPTGGQFAATAHAEPGLSLAANPISVDDLISRRDAIRERQERAREQAQRLDRLNQQLSVRTAAATVLANHPKAAVLRISENQDGENQYDIISLTDDAGNILAHVNHGDEWTYQTAGENAPYLEELVFELDPKDDAWAEGIGKVSGGGKWDFKTVDIDLRAALNAPLPQAPEEDDPHIRTLTEDEQRLLVETAREGMFELEDKLGKERIGDYSQEDIENIQAKLDTLNEMFKNR